MHCSFIPSAASGECICDCLYSAKEVDDTIEKFLAEFDETMQKMTQQEFNNLVSKFVDTDGRS
jgi:hypothetical protein